MSVKLLTEHHLEFLSLKGGCTCLSESTLVKMPHCWKSHVMGHLCKGLIEKPVPKDLLLVLPGKNICTSGSWVGITSQAS